LAALAFFFLPIVDYGSSPTIIVCSMCPNSVHITVSESCKLLGVGQVFVSYYSRNGIRTVDAGGLSFHCDTAFGVQDWGFGTLQELFQAFVVVRFVPVIGALVRFLHWLFS